MKQYADVSEVPAEWLGKLPAHWDYKKIGSLFVERKTKVSDKEYEPLSVAKIGVVPQLAHAAKTNAGDNRKLVCKGDFVINSRSDRKGSCGVSPLNGSVSLINIVLTPKHDLNEKYVHYLLRSQPFSEEFYRRGRGIVADLWTTRYSEMKNIIIPIPSETEQKQIVKVLDWKISIINRLVNTQREEIKILAELKRRKISSVVYRGIRDNLEVQNTGNKWLGDIPKNWHFKKLKRVVSLSTEKTTNSNMPYIGMENVSSWTSEYYIDESVIPESVCSIFQRGNILFGKLRPYLAKGIIADFEGVCSSEFLVFKDIKCNEKYLLYFLLNEKFIDNINSSTYGTKMPRANWEYIGTQLVPIPPKEEQDEIVRYLDSICQDINFLIEHKNKKIEELYEIKKTMIADIVLGRIDVRDINIPDFDFVEEEVEEKETVYSDIEEAEEE